MSRRYHCEMSNQDFYSEKTSLMTTENNRVCCSGPTKVFQNNLIVLNNSCSSKLKSMKAQKHAARKQPQVSDTMKKAKRKANRFNGVTEEELMTRLLPDRIKHGLDILIIGINPGLFSVYKGHHYVGPGNHFWKCLYLAGLIPLPLTGMEDYQALDFGIGFTNIVPRATPGSKDLSSAEIREGGKELIEKIKTYKPKVAVFNGKGIYEIFSKEIFGQKKKDFTFGRQTNRIPGTNTLIFVMPSSSARCAQFPRAQDKVCFFIQLKTLRDQLNAAQAKIDVVEANYTLDLRKPTEISRMESVKQETHDPSYEDILPVVPSLAETTAQPFYTTTSPSRHAPVNAEPTKKPNFTNGRKRRVGGAATEHPHLVKFLCQNDDPIKPAPPPISRPTMPNLNEVVSEELKNERVGMWIRTQINQDYESDPPMGYQERLRATEDEEQLESSQAIPNGSLQSTSAGVINPIPPRLISGFGTMGNTHKQERVETWTQRALHSNVPISHDRTPQPQRGIGKGHAVLATRSPYDTCGNFPMHQLVFPGTLPSSSASGGVCPLPLPLYGSWVGDGAGLAANLNSNSVIHPQVKMKTFLP